MVPGVELIERLEPNDAAAIWRRQKQLSACVGLLVVEDLADEFVRKVVAPVAFHERERGDHFVKVTSTGRFRSRFLCHGKDRRASRLLRPTR